MKIQLEEKIKNLLVEERLDSVIKELIKQTDFDKICLALSNICTFKSGDLIKSDKKESNNWYKLAKVFHKILESNSK